MNIILKMAFKNLYANKAKFFITLGLIGIGSYVIMLGLGVLNYAIQQTKDVSISDFSGDILLVGKTEDKKAQIDLFGIFKKVNLDPNMPEMPYLLKTDKIVDKLKSMKEVESFTKSVVTFYTLFKPVDLPDDWEAEKDLDVSQPRLQILGIDPEDYQKTFQTIQISGKGLGVYPKNGEEFILLPIDIKEQYEKYYARKLAVGDTILLQSFSFSSTDVTQAKVKVAGFFEFAHPNTPIALAYSDLSTARTIADMTLGAKTASEIPDSIDLTLSAKSEEDLFSDDSSLEKLNAKSVSNTSKLDYNNLLGDTSLRDSLNVADDQAWHHIAVKLKNSSNTKKVIKELNAWLTQQNINAVALDWEDGMARFVDAIKLIKKLLSVVLIILAIVVLVVIMNTLVAAVMQRTSEIGTMRAIGAKKSFVRRIFYAESMFMSLGGIILGLVLVLISAFIINNADIQLNKVMSIMFGSKVLAVSLTLGNIFWTSFAMLIAGILANWYPVRLALRVSPLEALNK